MVVSRISLINIYNVLKHFDENEGKIDSILINKKTEFGTRSVPRFGSLNELKNYLTSLYPFQTPEECSCLTKNESLYTLLSFSFVKKGDTVFVNNLPGGFQTAKPDMINDFHFKILQRYKTNWNILNELFLNYICYPYIEFGYIECDYIEIIRNTQYHELIKLYKNTKIQ